MKSRKADMDYKYEQYGNVGIFTFAGPIIDEHEGDLKVLLMRAIHSIDRAVLNFKKVTKIDNQCRQLLRTAYCSSLRLKNPLILTNVPKSYLPELFRCNINQESDYPFSAGSSLEQEEHYAGNN